MNKVNPGWIDGDVENSSQKTADVVNHSLKIAIEVKDDTKSLPARKIGTSSDGSYSAIELNKRFFSHIKDANRKFREYQQYNTVLLFRTNLPMAILVRSAVEGIHTFERFSGEQRSVPSDKENWIVSPRLTYSGRKGKHNRSEIGCFLVFNEDGYSYFPNEFAIDDRKVVKFDLELVFGFNFSDI